jgi:hypothetical protein
MHHGAAATLVVLRERTGLCDHLVCRAWIVCLRELRLTEPKLQLA